MGFFTSVVILFRPVIEGKTGSHRRFVCGSFRPRLPHYQNELNHIFGFIDLTPFPLLLSPPQRSRNTHTAFAHAYCGLVHYLHVRKSKSEFTYELNISRISCLDDEWPATITRGRNWSSKPLSICHSLSITPQRLIHQAE